MKWSSFCRERHMQFNGPSLGSLANFYLELERLCCSLSGIMSTRALFRVTNLACLLKDSARCERKTNLTRLAFEVLTTFFQCLQQASYEVDMAFAFLELRKTCIQCVNLGCVGCYSRTTHYLAFGCASDWNFGEYEAEGSATHSMLCAHLASASK